MMRYETEIVVEVLTDRDDDEFDQTLDDVLDALYDLDNVIDPDVSGSLRDRKISFTLSVEAENLGEAALCAFSAVRTAIHETGGSTPGWEDALRAATATTKPALVTA